jgi:hypothetical protein
MKISRLNLVPAALLLLAAAGPLAAQPDARPSHEGAKYGHADGSVAEILVSTYTTQHFVFHFAEDKAALADVFSTLEENYARVTKAFGARPAGRLKVEIYPDIRTYHKRTFGENSPDWAVGNFDPDELTLRMTSPNQPGSYHKHNDVLRAAVHEFVHSVTFAYRGGTRAGLPVWLDEGISMYYEGPMDGGTRKRVMEGVAAGKLPSIADMDADFLKSGGYAFSPTVVEFIVKKYGEKKFMKFVKDPASCERVLGITQAGLNDAWQAYLKETYK